jgi:hypothetical protein
VKVRVDERLRRRIDQLPASCPILIICDDYDFSRVHRAIQAAFDHGQPRRFQAKQVSEIPDLAAVLQAKPQQFFLFNPRLWETLPARLKRMANVASAFCEPDPQSLEETRIAAGVLL